MSGAIRLEPIPAELLRDSVTLILPTASGTTETPVLNVRVKRSEKLDSAASRPSDADTITVWADRINSTWLDYPVGARVRYEGALFEITERELFGLGEPHHCRFKARRIGG